MIVVLGGKKYNDKTIKELFCRNYLDLRMAKKESVNVNWQTPFMLFLPTAIFAAYRIEKLR